MSSPDHRSRASAGAGALAGLAVCGYLLPGLAGVRVRFVSDRSSTWALDGPVGTALCERLGIEDRTAGGHGYGLTFDDGPHAQGTPAVLEILAGANVSASFFLVGEQVRRNPALAREILAAGHSIGLHCDRHRNLLRLTPCQVRADLARAQDTIESVSGRAIGLYRPPYGVPNTAALALARARGWRTLLWSQWGRDWEARATPQSIAELVTNGVSAGSLLLLHDADDYSAPGSWRRTVGALPRVLDTLAGLGLAPEAP